MIDFTGPARAYFNRLLRNEQRAAANPELSQRRLLADLLRASHRTVWGRANAFSSIASYDDYAAALPVASYETFRPWVMRMIAGEPDILCPGTVSRFAQSSGTSGARSKYIPLPPRSLSRCHYRGAALSVASYLHSHPQSHLFAGKSFILGGSFANELPHLPSSVKVGDLSASLIDRINPLVNLLRIPDKSTALLSDWQIKLPRLVALSAPQDVRSISGVPSWFLTVLHQLLQTSSATDIRSLWPNLEVFFHGGISFLPYFSEYTKVIGNPGIVYWENYNASEGFLAAQWRPLPDDALKPMRLFLSTDIFYEFRLLRPDGSLADPVPLWEVSQGQVYALVITSSNGLWRYQLGDTVRIVSTHPLEITIAGRTSAFINAFGEELMVHNADRALSRTCAQTGASVADYTAAPVFAAGGRRGRHQWLIEWATPPADIHAFAALLDRHLQQENSDYAAKRADNIFLDPLSITSLPAGSFNSWLAATGRLGGQRKVPRLSNDRAIVDAILNAINSNNQNFSNLINQN